VRAPSPVALTVVLEMATSAVPRELKEEPLCQLVAPVGGRLSHVLPFIPVYPPEQYDQSHLIVVIATIVPSKQVQW
jgi:hypothetical protein